MNPTTAELLRTVADVANMLTCILTMACIPMATAALTKIANALTRIEFHQNTCRED